LPVSRLEARNLRVIAAMQVSAASAGRRLRELGQMARETLDGFSKDRGDVLAAALAFYTLLSIAPLVIVAVAIAGFILGQGTARQELLALLSETMGPGAAATVASWVDEASRSGKWATLVGVALVTLTASKVTAQLRTALNQVWNVEVSAPTSFKASVRRYAERRLFAVLLVIATGPLLIFVVLSRAFLTGVHELLFAALPVAALLVQLLQLLFSFALVALLTGLVFRIVPDAHLDWRSIRVGAVLTSLLFNAGNVLVGWYLARATVTATYGAAGSGVVILIWTYFSSGLFLLGAEFTQVYARHRGGEPETGDGTVRRATKS
jgi:membrane protein